MQLLYKAAKMATLNPLKLVNIQLSILHGQIYEFVNNFRNLLLVAAKLPAYKS